MKDTKTQENSAQARIFPGKFFDIFTSFSLEHGPFFSTWWPSEENAKKIIFFAEMAYTHVGTKYIKRP